MVFLLEICCLFEVFFTLPLCGLSFILACVAIITQNWVSGREKAVSREVRKKIFENLLVLS